MAVPRVRYVEERSVLTLIRKAPLARELGVSTYTIERWVKQGLFPKPIHVMDGSPATWRLRDVEAWLEKRRGRRRQPPPRRGNLKQYHDGDE
jgi:predicted DNA-binding transcriptional regulator AlpA